MTKDKVVHAFFSSFMDSYPATAVPDDVIFPYLTYEYTAGAFDDGENGLTVNFWFYTDSEAVPNAKAQELSDKLGVGGKVFPCDGGYVWLKRGSPWCQSLRDEANANVKRRYINVTVEYLTAT